MTIEYKLKNTNSNVILFDNSKKVLEEFRREFFATIIDILEGEEITFYLRDINIYFEDTTIDFQKLGKIYSTGKSMPRGLFEAQRFGLIFEVDCWFMAFKYRDRTALLNYLRYLITHELVHYFHYAINSSLLKIWKANVRLIKKYRTRYKKFVKSYGPEKILEFLNLFVEKCVCEGFAEFFKKYKHEQIKFSEDYFHRYYREAQESAVVLIREYQSLEKIKNKTKRMDEFATFLEYLGGESQWYIIGFHIIYSILYLHEDKIEDDIKFLLEKFNTHFGRLRPKKVIDIYDMLMQRRGLEPIITFRHFGGIINCHKIVKEWKSIFR